MGSWWSSAERSARNTFSLPETHDSKVTLAMLGLPEAWRGASTKPGWSGDDFDFGRNFRLTVRHTAPTGSASPAIPAV